MDAVVPIERPRQYERWEEEHCLELIEERRNSPTVSFDEVLQETLGRVE